MAEKVYKSIHDKIDKASLSKIMAVSNIFGRGFGEKRNEPILLKYPDRGESFHQHLLKIAMAELDGVVCFDDGLVAFSGYSYLVVPVFNASSVLHSNLLSK